MASASDRQPGVMIGHETPVEIGHQVSRWPLQAAICPRGAEGIPSQLLVDRRKEAHADVRPAAEARQFVHGPRTALGVDDEPDVDREVRHPGEDRPIAADLLREHLASLGAEVALDKECDRPIADPDAGQRVGSEKATEDVSADPLRNPGEDPLSEQRVAMPEERREEVEGRELVDRRGRRQVRRPVRATMRPGEALDVDPRRPVRT